MNISPAQLSDIAASLWAALGDDFEQQAFLDTLEGETDVMEVADRMISEMLEAEALADAIVAQLAALKARHTRIESRQLAFKAQLLDLLQATGLSKLERPRATISRTKGRASVRINDEAAIPSQLCRVTVAPDLVAIGAQLRAGEAVPGAVLETGPESLSVRVK